MNTRILRPEYLIVRDQLVWDKSILLQQLAHEFQRRALVPPALDLRSWSSLRRVIPTCRAPSRRCKQRKAIYAWVDPAEHRKLKKLSLETERSIDALVTEAVRLLFEKHSVE
jgi:hypothetical protein